MSSSWLENIAAQHGGAEVEEEEEEEDVAPPAPVAQASPQPNNPNESTSEPNTDKTAQQIPSEEVKKESTIEKPQAAQPSDNKSNKPEQTIKKPIYEGPITREQFLFAKSMKKLFKGQENEYCLAMINSRRDFAKMMEYSARPLQNASALSGITSDCKTKYDSLSTKIMGLPIPMPLKTSSVSK